MSDVTDITEFIKGKKKSTIAEIPPTNRTPRRSQKRKQDPIIKPYADPGLEELIGLPVSVPILRREIKKQRIQEDIIEKEVERIKLYRQKPLLFWRDELGMCVDNWKDDKPPKDWRPGDPIPLWSKQREVIEALVKHRKVAVKSGHGVGKTFLGAGCALYLAYVYHATGLTTAPTFRQVRRLLWGEIHYQYNRAKNPLGGKLNQVSLDLGDKWYVEGFATDKPMENITGMHEENVFVIVDEAGGVLPDTFEALEAVLTSDSSFVLYIGNPIVAEGAFFDAFRPDSGFKTYSISCYDCPNVKYDRIIYPKLTSTKWVKDKEKKWGVESNLFKIRVAGEFPEESKDALIPIKYIEVALRKGTEGDVRLGNIVSFGLDVARQGSDSSVFGAKYDSGWFKVLDVTQKKRETETAGRMKSLYDEKVPNYCRRHLAKVENRLKEERGEETKEPFYPPINVDDIGVGGGVLDILVEDEYPVNGINVGKPPDPHIPEEEKLFLNKRAQYYWKLKLAFERGEVIIDDEELANELSKIKAEFLRSGKIKIIDKDKIKQELKGRSPDRAECMMLAYAEEYAETEIELVRFL